MKNALPGSARRHCQHSNLGQRCRPPLVISAGRSFFAFHVLFRPAEMATLVSREARQKVGDRHRVFDHWAARGIRVVFWDPGLRERASALPLGHFPEGLGSRKWEGAAPPEKDLGGLRR